MIVLDTICFEQRWRLMKHVNMYSMIHLLQYTLVDYVQLAAKWIQIENVFPIENEDISFLQYVTLTEGI